MFADFIFTQKKSDTHTSHGRRMACVKIILITKKLFSSTNLQKQKEATEWCFS